MLGIYCRISQEKEEGKDRSLEYQKKIGVELAKELGISYRVYIDDGVSGTWEIEKRPAFYKLLQDITKKGSNITAVYGYTTSRLYRNESVRIQFLSLIRKHKIKVYYEKKEFDWSDPQSKFLDTILSATNELSVDLTRINVRGILKERALKEKVHGVMPYGYMRDENDKMIIDSKEANIVQQIFKWSNQGIGYKAISDKLNDLNIPTRYNGYKGTYEVDINRNNSLPKKIVIKQKGETKWVHGTIKNILNNDTYTGIRRFGDVSFKIPVQILPDRCIIKQGTPRLHLIWHANG